MRRPILFLSLVFFAFAAHAQTWSKLGTGLSGLNGWGNNGPYAMCADKYGNVYVTGWFWDVSIDSDYRYNNVYKWDGLAWSELGSGSAALNSYYEHDSLAPEPAIGINLCADTNGNIYSIAYKDSFIYVAEWDGTSWSALGGVTAFAGYGINSICLDKANNLYTYYMDSGYLHVEKWDGTAWHPVDTGSSLLYLNYGPNVIYVDSAENVYIAGPFTDGITDSTGNLYVAKWDGTSWSELGSGVAPQHGIGIYQIFSLQMDKNGILYAGGRFGENGTGNRYIAQWDGTTWSEPGAGSGTLNANGTIHSLCMDKYNNLYAAGTFTDTSLTTPVADSGINMGSHPYYVAKWDGTTWSKLGSGSNSLYANDWIMVICADANGNVYAGGQFTDTTVTEYFIDTVYTGPGYYLDTEYYHPYYVAKFANPALSVAPLQRIDPAINVYPNPTHSVINVTTVSANEFANAHYAVYDYSMRAYRSGTLNGNKASVDLENLAAGVYILVIENGETSTFRIVKE